MDSNIMLVNYSKINADTNEKIKLEINFNKFFFKLFKQICRKVWSYPLYLKDFGIIY